MKRAKTIAVTGLCVALALILAYVELLLPPLAAAIPGIKMGLPNVIVVFLLYRRGVRSAIGVSLLRIVLVGILFGNAMSLMYSLAGGVLSLLVMIGLRRIDRLSVVGVSVAGAVAHNVGQILTAMVLLDTAQLAYYLVVLAVTGTVAGILIGLCGALLIRRIPENVING